VHLMLLCQPVGYETGADGRLSGLRVVRTQLGEPDPSGRRSPVPVAGSEFVLSADMVVEALGETLDPILANVLSGVELTRDGLVRVDEATLATARAGVWAAGDLVNGGATVVRAVAEGKRAAEQIDAFLTARAK
ncbi:MAG TPA: FAD-dependent oxidoreductase, partial [Phycisphaerae bacterium]|nr:FAD-dependent oxidoreductase [Phycisphaerae bacterium]